MNRYGGKLSPGINLDELEVAYGNPIRSGLLTAEEIENRPPPTPLIDNVITEGSFSVLFGKWGTAKSFVALDWAMCIGLGWPWQGQPVAGGNVIYITAEGATGMGKRVKAWRQAFQPDVRPDVDFYPDVVSLLNEGQVEQLADVVREKQTKLVIFDTLNRSIPGGDENSATVMSQAVASAQRIQKVGAAVMLVHHLGHQGGEPRGHSSLPGAADHMIRAWRPDSKRDQPDDGFLMLFSHKQKDQEPFDPFKLRLRQVRLERGSSCVIEAA